MTEAQPAEDRSDTFTFETRDELPEHTSGRFASFRSGFMAGPELEPEESLPNRYEIRALEDRRVLICGEAPGVAVSIDRDHGFSEADARRLGGQVVFLDGAGQFGPAVDNSQFFYNLDHHQDCLRAFTLATCQQALIVVVKGLELDSGDWTVFANEPDLDTVFAIWILLNYRRVRQLDETQRDAILPLILLEGAIDANGFEIAEHCGLPQKLLRAEKARLDKLHAIELELKKTGQWGSMDLFEHTQNMLLEIDKLVYRPADFADYTSVEEVYGHVDIGMNRVAVVCRDGSGIYEVERRLKKSWGERLGVIALERAEGQYTLRRTASMAGIDLEEAYAKLNLLDPRVDGRPPAKRWGGSDEIGGSPRPDGTALTPREITKILKLTYRKVNPLEHLQRFASVALWVILLVLGAATAVASWRVFVEPAASSRASASELALAAGVIGFGAWLLTRKLSRGWTWLFGWRRPAGRDWLALVPVAVLGAAAGGVWVPREMTLEGPGLATLAASMALAAIALELCFRGLVHGLLVLDSPVQTAGSRWFISRPVVASTLLYAATTAIACRSLLVGPPTLPPELQMITDLGPVAHYGLAGLGALLVGLALGMIRERALSIWPAVVTALVGGAVRVALEIWYVG